MWEQLQAPIVPLLTYGAFELFPKSKCTPLSESLPHSHAPPCPPLVLLAESWVNLAGRVHIRYLKPIYPQEAASRQEMAVLVRRRMLQALKQCPEDLAKEVSPYTYWSQMCVVVGTIALTGLSTRHLLTHVVTPTQFAIGSTGITIGLYVYYVYAINMWPFVSHPKKKGTHPHSADRACLTISCRQTKPWHSMLSNSPCGKQ